jgi:hypothetical protein
MALKPMVKKHTQKAIILRQMEIILTPKVIKLKQQLMALMLKDMGLKLLEAMLMRKGLIHRLVVL